MKVAVYGIGEFGARVLDKARRLHDISYIATDGPDPTMSAVKGNLPHWDMTYLSCNPDAAPPVDAAIIAGIHVALPLDGMEDMTRLGFYAYHPSLLPDYPLMSCVEDQWRDDPALLGGSLVELGPDGVSGNGLVIRQEQIQNPHAENAYTLWHQYLSPLGENLLHGLFKEWLT